jgi:predicted dehydrogenase
VETLKAAVIGLGIGKRHAMVLSRMEGVDLVAVADLKEGMARELAAQLNAHSYGDGTDLLAAEELDFVCVCTPPGSHLALTRQAAGRAVNVFCEKPMAPTLAECDEMIVACREAEVKLMIGQKKRFQPAYQFVKRMCEEQFGPPRWAVVRYACGRVPMDWFWQEENGGGPLMENTVHAVDLLRYLMGEVERVYAEGANLFNQEREPQLDTAAATLRFRKGAIASLGCGQAYEWGFATESAYFAHDRAIVEVRGSFDNPEHVRYVLREDPEHVVSIDRGETDLFKLELRHFSQCLRQNRRPLVTGEEGRASVAVCLALKESARSGEPAGPG